MQYTKKREIGMYYSLLYMIKFVFLPNYNQLTCYTFICVNLTSDTAYIVCSDFGDLSIMNNTFQSLFFSVLHFICRLHSSRSCLSLLDNYTLSGLPCYCVTPAIQADYTLCTMPIEYLADRYLLDIVEETYLATDGTDCRILY